MEFSSTSLVLLFVATDSARVISAYTFFHTSSAVSPSLVVGLSELCKLLVACVGFWHSKGDVNTIKDKLSARRRRGFTLYSIPAIFYFVNNIVFMNALPVTSPTLLQACTLAKIPATAWLHHVWVKKQTNIHAWGSLAWLSLALMIFVGLSSAPLFPLVVGLLVLLLSPVANISAESISKCDSFWESQIYLGAWGTIFSFVLCPFADMLPRVPVESEDSTAFPGVATFAIVVALLSTIVGFISASITRKENSLGKLVGSSASLFSIAYLQYRLTTDTLSLQSLSAAKGFAGIVIGVASLIYCKSKDKVVEKAQWTETNPEVIPLQGYAKEGEVEEVEEEGEKQMPRPLVSQPMFLYDAIGCGYLPEPTVSSWANVMMIICPSFLDFRQNRNSKPTKLYPTTYLDGIRGFAALFVAFNHALYDWYPDYFSGWDGEDNKAILQMPWIRITISGGAMVFLFFVVSGFSISYKPMKLLRKGDIPEFNRAVASFLFRRHLRLYLPIAGISFFMMLARYFDWYLGDGYQAPQSPFFWEQVNHWIESIFIMSNPFNKLDLMDLMNSAFSYDLNLWTIPFEMRGSVVVLFIIIATAHIRQSLRHAVMVSIIAYALYTNYWDIFLFVSGLFLSDLHLNRQEHTKGMLVLPTQQPSQETTASKEGSSMLKNIFWLFNFVATTFLLSLSNDASGGWGRSQVWRWTPAQYVERDNEFWYAIAAVNFVFMIDNVPFLQVLFTNRLARYLGKISYSLYIVHGTMVRTFARHFVPYMVTVMLRADTTYTLQARLKDKAVGVTIGLLTMGVITIWMADLATTAFDEGAVKLMRWLYDSWCEPEVERPKNI